jgi:hypothetical protein
MLRCPQKLVKSERHVEGVPRHIIVKPRHGAVQVGLTTGSRWMADIITPRNYGSLYGILQMSSREPTATLTAMYQ